MTSTNSRNLKSLNSRSLNSGALATALTSAWFLPLVFGVAGLAVWEVILWWLDPAGFVLPRPSEIGVAFSEEWSIIRQATQNTGFVIYSSFLAGSIMGAVAALLVARFRPLGEALTPLAVAINTIPIVALAPIFNNWLGLTSNRSNQAVVILLVFFPVFINTTRGLLQVNPNHLDLMRSLASTPWRIIRKVSIPTALPFFFTALKLVSSLSVVGAIVVEYFGGPQTRLGNLITTNAGFTKYDVAWAAVLAGSLIGIALYALVAITERLVSSD